MTWGFREREELVGARAVHLIDRPGGAPRPAVARAAGRDRSPVEYGPGGPGCLGLLRVARFVCRPCVAGAVRFGRIRFVRSFLLFPLSFLPSGFGALRKIRYFCSRSVTCVGKACTASERMKRKERDREATERRLLEAVGELVCESGFEQIGINALAARAGVSKVLVYRYFGSVDGLLAAYVRRHDFWFGLPDGVPTGPACLTFSSGCSASRWHACAATLRWRPALSLGAVV